MQRKKDGTWRFCIDFRRLNKITEDTAQAIPHISEVIKNIGKACIFSILYLKNGYWQIPLDEKSQKYTAFKAPEGGCYMWRVMCFGLKNAPATLKAVLEAMSPKQKKDLHKFFGVCGWLREYVPNFASVAAPLTPLLSPKKAWRWTPDLEEAFRAVKDLFRKPLQLHRPDQKRTIYLQVDASAHGIGCVVYQLSDSEERQVISYASAKINNAEAKQHCNEQECLAAVWATKPYKWLIEDKPFVLRTNSRALTWLDRIQDERGNVSRWAQYLSALNMKVEHVPGRCNELADALSRNPEDELFIEDTEDLDRLLPPSITEPPLVPMAAHLSVCTLYDEIQENQKNDEFIAGVNPLPSQLERKNGIVYFIEKGHEPRLYVPRSDRTRLIRLFHDDQLALHP